METYFYYMLIGIIITLYICCHICSKNKTSIYKSNYIPIIKYPNVKIYDAIIIRQYP